MNNCRFLILTAIMALVTACGGGVTEANSESYSVESGLAQKGPLVQGSQVTINELSTNKFQPSGNSFTFDVSSNLGKFNPSGIKFNSPYLSTTAIGYYFNEITGQASTDVVFLRGLSDLSAGADTAINVNVLSGFSKNRILNLATGANLINPATSLAYTSNQAPLPFQRARAQAQAENLKAFYIYNGTNILSGASANGVTQPANFTAMDLSRNRTADQILAAISAVVMTAGQNGNGVNTLLSQIEADFADDGILNNSPKYTQSVQSRLCAAAANTNFAAVATNLNNFYGTNYQATDLNQWVDTSGCVDQVIEKYKFSATNVAVGTVSKSPAYIAGPDDVGQCFSVGGVTSGAIGSLYYNGATTTVVGTQVAKLGDSLTIGLNASAPGNYSGFMQRSAPDANGVCPTGVATTGVVRILKYTITSGFTIGGTISGLLSGQSIILLNNGVDALTVSADGNFTFATTLSNGTAFSVTVGTQPTGEACRVSGGTGNIAANINSVIINCGTTSTGLHLGTFSGINLNLISPITVNGKTFYFLDQNSNGTADCGDDSVDHIKLNNLFNAGKPTTATANSVVIGGYTLSLATNSDIIAIRTQYNYVAPSGWAWQASSGFVCNFSTSDLAGMINSSTGVHYNVYMASNTGQPNNPTYNGIYTNLYDGYGYDSLVAISVTGGGSVKQVLDLTIPGNSGPWSVTSNPTMSYSRTASSPIIVDLNTLKLSAGGTLDLKCTGGQGTFWTTTHPCISDVIKNINSSSNPSASIPGYADPDHEGQIVGVFANAAGVVIGNPFVVSENTKTVTIPQGATRIQFGVNDNYYPDNTGGVYLQLIYPGSGV